MKPRKKPARAKATPRTVVVYCSRCPWRSQRPAASALATPCPKCGAEVVRGRPTAGRPASERERLELQLLPATIAWLGERPAKRAAEILDVIAAADAKARAIADAAESAQPRAPMRAIGRTIVRAQRIARR